MIILDGVVYQAAADGSINVMSDSETVAFCSITNFDENGKITDITAKDFDDLTSQWCNTGMLEYELSSAESIDNNTHTFNYTLEELQELGYGIK